MIAELLRRFWAGAVALASLLVTLLLVSKMQKDKGKLEERLEQQKEKLEGKIEEVQKEASKTVEAVKNAVEVEKNVSGMHDSDVDDRLRDKWNG